MTVVSLTAAAYIAELYVIWSATTQLWPLAQRLGLPFDARRRPEVVRDLRREGKRATVEVHPILVLDRAERLGLVPLAGISNAATVLCNETGLHVIYQSDERGFRNPPGAWSTPELQVATLGDSFTQGMCVGDEDSAVGLLRRVFPRTLNLGMSGDGPLLELATLKEYLPELRPARVLWFFFEGNDGIDLEKEKESQILRRYLEPDYRQGLAGRQAEIDAVLESWLIDEYNAAAKQSFQRDSVPPWFWKDFLMLRASRRAAGLLVPVASQRNVSVDEILLREVLTQASQTISGWGGKLYFVYLPWQARYHDRSNRRRLDELRDRMLSIARSLELPTIDVEPAVRQHGGGGLYVRRPNGHFTAEGYRVVAQAVLEAISTEERLGARN
jgi:lysophospholipase L1-like esterase